jgi:hypothetical protein
VPNGYKVDGEVGRFYFTTHRVQECYGVYNTALDLFPALKAKEWYRTFGFKEIAMIHGDVEISYRKTTELINRIRYQQKDGTPSRTLQHNTEQEGAEIIGYLERKASNILKSHRILENGTYGGDPQDLDSIKPQRLPEETIKKAAEDLVCEYVVEDLLNNPVCIEDPSKSVNISIDDVSVKKQSEERGLIAEIVEKQGKKYIHNTVARIDKDKKSYSLVGAGIKATLLYLVAFLFSNRFLGYRFQFFTDGHKLLNDTINKHFNWYPNFGIILDWFHLVKKCKEQLSMAMKGRKIRNEVLRKIMPLLWHGLTDRAITLLEQIEAEKIKDTDKYTKLLSYLDRNREMIPCYAIRKRLGLKNSSAIGEKMNDVLVSSRQKHNGMSWSKNGSLALAALTAVKRNGEDRSWLEKKELKFKLVA